MRWTPTIKGHDLCRLSANHAIERRIKSALAERTIKRRALAKGDDLHRRTADLAWVACASVNEQLLEEVARRAIRREKVTQRGATTRDCVGKNALHLVGELRIALPCQFSRGAARLAAFCAQ